MITAHAFRAYCEQDEISLTQVMKNVLDLDSLVVTLNKIYSLMLNIT